MFRIHNVLVQNLLLVVFGAIVGSLLVLIIWISLFRGSDGAPKFDSVAQLHQALIHRDDRDVLPGGSVSLRSIIEPDETKEIIFRMIPNLDVKFQKVPVRTNSFGLRGPEITRAKPADTFRVVLLGDSFAFGWGVNEEESFSHKLQELLQDDLISRAKRPGTTSDITSVIKHVEVLNFGVPGYSTFQEVALLKNKGLNFSPDLVVVFFVENDFGLPYFLDTQGGMLQEATSFVTGMFRTRKPESVQRHKELVNMSDANRALLSLDKLLKKEKLPGYLFLNPGGHHPETLKKLWARGKLRTLRFVDLFAGYNQLVEEGKYERSTLRLPDDPHPSALKHRLLAQLMAPYLIESMQAIIPQTKVSE